MRAGLLLVGVIVILTFAASTAYDAWRSYRHSVLSTERELENLASALAAQTAWSWQGIDLLLTDISRWHREYPEASTEAIDQFLAVVTVRVPQARSVRLVDAQGILQHSSDERGRRGLDVSDRSYFRAQKDASQGLFVSEPLVTRSEGRIAVVLSRRLEDSQGRFAGVVTANVDLGNLSELYAAVNLRGDAIQLLRDDGTLLARSPPRPALVGQTFPTLVARGGAALRIRNPTDDAREFIATARVHSAPLVVTVTRKEDEALGTAYQEAIHGTLRTLVLTLLGVVTIAALLRQLRRIEQTAMALRQSQKMEAIGTLAGGIAHEFNNILGAIVGHGELAQQRAPEGSALQRHLDSIMHAAGRAQELVDRILGFSRSGLAERAPIAIQSVVFETLELLRASLPPSIRLEKELSAPDAAVLGDETRLHQVTMNLCTNAAKAMRDGGTLRVTLEQVELTDPRVFSRGKLGAGAYVLLTISDSGTGISSDHLHMIFDPFFTTKPVGEGTGLGLSLVDGIVADLGGAIEVSSEVGTGTTFRVWLPKTSETARPAYGKARDFPRGNGQTIMVVDDEQPLVSVMEEMLAELNYEAVGFESSTAALQAFQSDPHRFDAVLTDAMMPDLVGSELARRLEALRPDVPIILMSGYAGPELDEQAAAAGVREVLRKPLRKRDIAEALRKVLSERAKTDLT